VAAPKKDALVEVDETNPDVFINKSLGTITDNEELDFDALMRLAEETEQGVIEFVGSIWQVVKKEVLMGVPFFIFDVRHYQGKFGDAVAVMCITKEPVKGETGDATDHVVINDGSTGLYQQVVEMIKRAKTKSGILCPRGLRSSTYDYDIEDPFSGKHETGEATTYYVA
jgi:hypothetical protein